MYLYLYICIYIYILYLYIRSYIDGDILKFIQNAFQVSNLDLDI